MRLSYLLDMVLPINPAQERAFICEEDSNLAEENQTRFAIRSLSASERSQIEDNAISQDGSGEQRLRTGSMLLASLHLGLMGWDNFPPGGPERVFRSKGKGLSRKVSEKTLSAIPPDVRQELAQAILSGSHLTEEQSGN